MCKESSTHVQVISADSLFVSCSYGVLRGNKQETIDGYCTRFYKTLYSIRTMDNKAYSDVFRLKYRSKLQSIDLFLD